MICFKFGNCPTWQKILKHLRPWYTLNYYLLLFENFLHAGHYLECLICGALYFLFVFNTIDFCFWGCLHNLLRWEGLRVRECGWDHGFLIFFFFSCNWGKGVGKRRSLIQPPNLLNTQRWRTATQCHSRASNVSMLRGFCSNGLYNFEMLLIVPLQGWRNLSKVHWLT